MRVLPGDQPAPDDLRGAAIALGVMDGVHLGHQAVIAAARAAAQANRRKLCAAVFEPPPRRFFQPEAPPFRIQTAAQRARALAALGVDAVYELPFGQAMAVIAPPDFTQGVLKDRLQAGHVAVGFDFRYGRARSGDAGSLQADGAALGFTVSVTPQFTHGGQKVSSTAIRALIGEGKVDAAAALLSRPWAIEGEVQDGDKRGRTLGFPTANIFLGDYVRPRFGVYAVRTAIDGISVGGVANIGLRPTIGGDAAPRLEAHLFDFDGDLYGRVLDVELIAFLRPEQKFAGLDALQAQIAKDAEAARARLG